MYNDRAKFKLSLSPFAEKSKSSISVPMPLVATIPSYFSYSDEITTPTSASTSISSSSGATSPSSTSSDIGQSSPRYPPSLSRNEGSSSTSSNYTPAINSLDYADELVKTSPAEAIAWLLHEGQSRRQSHQSTDAISACFIRAAEIYIEIAESFNSAKESAKSSPFPITDSKTLLFTLSAYSRFASAQLFVHAARIFIPAHCPELAFDCLCRARTEVCKWITEAQEESGLVKLVEKSTKERKKSSDAITPTFRTNLHIIDDDEEDIVFVDAEEDDYLMISPKNGVEIDGLHLIKDSSVPLLPTPLLSSVSIVGMVLDIAALFTQVARIHWARKAIRAYFGSLELYLLLQNFREVSADQVPQLSLDKRLKIARLTVDGTALLTLGMPQLATNISSSETDSSMQLQIAPLADDKRIIEVQESVSDEEREIEEAEMAYDESETPQQGTESASDTLLDESTSSCRSTHLPPDSEDELLVISNSDYAVCRNSIERCYMAVADLLIGSSWKCMCQQLHVVPIEPTDASKLNPSPLFQDLLPAFLLTQCPHNLHRAQRIYEHLAMQNINPSQAPSMEGLSPTSSDSSSSTILHSEENRVIAFLARASLCVVLVSDDEKAAAFLKTQKRNKSVLISPFRSMASTWNILRRYCQHSVPFAYSPEYRLLACFVNRMGEKSKKRDRTIDELDDALRATITPTPPMPPTVSTDRNHPRHGLLQLIHTRLLLHAEHSYCSNETNH